MPRGPRGRAPRIVTHAILISGGLLAGALVAEGPARLVLDPVDYLAVTPVPDSILGFRLKPFTSGHDAWGFRNRKVPDRAERS